MGGTEAGCRGWGAGGAWQADFRTLRPWTTARAESPSPYSERAIPGHLGGGQTWTLDDPLCLSR